ncbi:hypothetical protein DFJ58DRAFT_871537 [Suillus subalutaceus]|uniref:uncharacterized protein n=1 Tax=Suillus subalutaceus TaxID=48586 RepID=UPI001B872E0A|nr:uncharacterized protein DFJ58DRAFT_871537 [Suillus subalutaceus]KAG1831668.1 hypothetical protein DFJ58DRAFT_871537 [Suillus subalutaceus]
MAASNIHTNVFHPPSIITYEEAPVIDRPSQSMEASASEAHNPPQPTEPSPAAGETVAQSLKRLECLIEANTERQKDQFIELQRTLSANGKLAQQSILLAHQSIKKAEDAITLAKDIKNDTRGLVPACTRRGAIPSDAKPVRIPKLRLSVHTINTEKPPFGSSLR